MRVQENQEREQYFFEDETLAWLAGLISRTPRVAAIFMPSLLRFPNAWVFDADERFDGRERYTRIDVTRGAPDLAGFGMVLLDPPFALAARHMGRLLDAARGRPVLVSATDWCVACAGWGEIFASHGLALVTAHFPRYRSIGNGYCEATLKRDGRTNIAFYSNIPFAPPRRTAILRRDGGWTTFDPYDFRERLTTSAPPPAEADEPVREAASVSAVSAKAIEIERYWETMQRARRSGWALRLMRRLGLGG